MRLKLFIIERQVRVSSRTYTKIEINTKWSRQSHVLVAIWQLKREQVYVSLTLTVLEKTNGTGRDLCSKWPILTKL